MPKPLVLASGSTARLSLLQAAGVPVEAHRARVDEAAMRAALEAEDAPPRDIADALAEMKARRVGERMPDRLVLGCDQVLAFEGAVLAKPHSRDAAHAQLIALRDKPHSLLSAAVIIEDSKPVWRHVGVARLRMRAFSDTYLEAYLDRNWPDIGDSVGGYKLESEGVRLFTRIDGDYFTILGLPLLEVLSYLTLREEIPG